MKTMLGTKQTIGLEYVGNMIHDQKYPSSKLINPRGYDKMLDWKYNINEEGVPPKKVVKKKKVAADSGTTMDTVEGDDNIIYLSLIHI